MTNASRQFDTAKAEADAKAAQTGETYAVIPKSGGGFRVSRAIDVPESVTFSYLTAARKDASFRGVAFCTDCPTESTIQTSEQLTAAGWTNPCDLSGGDLYTMGWTCPECSRRTVEVEALLCLPLHDGAQS